MDEEKKTGTNNVNVETKEAIANQLDSFINPNDKTKNTPNIGSYSSMQEKVSPINVENLDNKEQPKQNRPIIRTYKSDVEETIQTNHISSINMAIAENRKMLSQQKTTDIETKKIKLNRNIMVISVILVVGGALTFIIPKLLIQAQYGPKATPIETVSSAPIITVDVEEKINIQDIVLNRVSTTLKERVDQSSTQLGQIKNYFLTEGTGTAETLITASHFLSLMNATLPSEIQRTLKNPYMFGSYNYNGNQRFLILKVGAYDTTFSGMLQWETNLWQDFKELFSLKNDNSTLSATYGLDIKKFQDATFYNKDCRVVRDSSGNIIFLYSIIDEDTVVITTSTDTLREIINRVSKARVVTQ